MLTELLAESQVTLPQTMIDRLGLSVGDLLVVTERDGGVFIAPAAGAHGDRYEMSHQEYQQFLDETYRCIDDPTFVEPPEIRYESPREPIQ